MVDGAAGSVEASLTYPSYSLHMEFLTTPVSFYLLKYALQMEENNKRRAKRRDLFYTVHYTPAITEYLLMLLLLLFLTAEHEPIPMYFGI